MAAPSVSYACKCDRQLTVAENLEKSSTVFAGKVIEIKEKKQAGVVVEMALFEVERIWKGPTDSQIILESIQSSCSFDFRKGEDYIVYAKPNAELKNEAALTTGVCDRTAALEKADEDLELLGKGSTPEKIVDLSGELNGPGLIMKFVWIPIVGVAAAFGYWIWRPRT
ncbi:hypothetical protein [Neobacillus notoginsengisoli]|nr:hypothetical protein [Neobacillus notoginsengisoli]